MIPECLSSSFSIGLIMAAPGIFAKLTLFQSPACVGARNMATLKDIRLRLRSVKNIQKITKSMKMVSAAKFARAERELKSAKVYGKGATALYEKGEIGSDESKPNHLMFAISSDRGLCGGIHSGMAKAIKAKVVEKGNASNPMIVICGDKVRGILQRTLGDKVLMHMSETGRKPPVFSEASFIAGEILDSGFEFDAGEMFYNEFKSVVSFKVRSKDLPPLDAVADSENINLYDDVDADVLRNYHEFTLASIVYYGLKESACSEQSSRMTAMDSASKNAGEMIDKLTLTFNRTRQAVITKELIEIVSGAAALE
ncbi:ATP synthase subunit gamma, mitochondrial-like [Rhopilema esculentum]|uniref:ATP synthase subunit gamma, mitochondrial-like n=1 Tax=Rhopilema esculentum TaxID=499914 RepID=UPI0031D18D7D